ncbi:hypothetical protein BV22DRAFT_557849 [Leucogyrophana mollusca]|uniref:Uncharacterized protein n=1 Tax=Leucogyrophana mollusca TaxID=85980 RepID=A0ACB8BH12_9AGAM|nr:hypothetical protein BV22DRAFT_557849 [Leucogyrophana mollusca]
MMDSGSHSGQTGIPSSSFDEYNSTLQGTALKATRHAVSLPTDLAFHRSMDSDLAQELDAFSSRVLSLTNSLLALVSTSETAQNARGKGRAKLESQDDVVDGFHSLVVDSMDQLLERTDNCLDQYLGRIKAPAIAVNVVPEPQKSKKSNAPKGRLDPALQHASHLPKPQLRFKSKVDNFTETPWYPTLPHKYNAQVPLGYHFHDSEDDSSPNKISVHPYQYEIKHLSYPTRMFRATAPIPPKSFDETPFTWISTHAAFNAMMDKLRRASDIAVDLEHHSHRTYSGFLCLMQISTRSEDFVVDTLALRDELHELNEVFTDPKIVKVFHGAESDIVWLQQDFNLFIVNLFDTYHASKVLDFPKHGLAYLLEIYCDFIPEKQYQLADWRIRPLPEAFLAYARSDTHFLLFVYDNLRNALLDRSQSRAQSPRNEGIQVDAQDPAQALVREVLSRSEETSLRVYEREVYDAENGAGPGGWDTLAKKWNKGALTVLARESTQREVYRSIHAWRDRIAREEDESTRFVLPNHYLFQIAEKPPSDVAALLSIFQPVPPVLRRRAKELLDAVKDAVARHATNGIIPPPVASTEDVVIEVEVNTASAPVETSPSITNTASSRLWGSMSVLGAPVQRTSSLFGSTVPSRSADHQTAMSYASSRSSLFGTRSGSLQASRLVEDKARFKELLSRIHSTLVISPSAPQALSATTSKSTTQFGGTITANTSTNTTVIGDAEMVSVEGDINGTGQAEIPYVPSNKRQPHSGMDVIDDSIVVVGQVRQKKRKRPKTSMAQDAGLEINLPGSDRSPRTAEIPAPDGNASKRKQKQDRAQGSENSEEHSQDVVPFDYTAVPNLLDDGPSPEVNPDLRQKKKPKQTKSGVIEYGNFRAPPRDFREVKGGNKTHTFK